MKVLVAEKIASSGIEMLKESYDVEVKTELSPEELVAEIGAYDGLIVRSATKVTREVIEAADNMKIIGRAGVGVDNVDVQAATERGIIVCNAPTSNIVSAAEHTIALMLAQSRNIPQAAASMKECKWERSKFVGTGGLREDAGDLRPGPHRLARCRARSLHGHAPDRFRPVRHAGARSGHGRRGLRECR